MQNLPANQLPIASAPGASGEANVPGPAEATSSHVHHWRIGAQAGPSSQGLCDCGDERTFANSHEPMPNSYRSRQAPFPRPGRNRA